MKIELDDTDLQPLIARVVAETLQQVAVDNSAMNGRIAFTEQEAADLLGVERHVLRDARRRREIEASQVGKRIMYTRSQLDKFLVKTRWEG